MADVAAPLDTTSTAVASTTDATPAPSSPETGTSAPASAGDTAAAVWKEMQTAESGGTPPDAPPDPSPAQAAIQPDGSPEAPGSLPNRGPIPFDRHQAVLTRTRNEVGEKARRETLAEFGIAEGLSPEEVRTGVTMLQSLKRGGVGFLDYLRSQIDPQAAVTASPQKPVVEDTEPEPDVPLQDGRFVYSAEQLRKRDEWRERKLMAQFDEKYGPIRDAHELNQLKATATAEAKQLMAQAKDWPRFAQLKPHIAKIIAAQGRLTATSLYDAYIAADGEHGEKLLREKWDAERSGQLTRKADASTVQPGAPRPSTPRQDVDLSTRDIVRQEWRRAAG